MLAGWHLSVWDQCTLYRRVDKAKVGRLLGMLTLHLDDEVAAAEPAIHAELKELRAITKASRRGAGRVAMVDDFMREAERSVEKWSEEAAKRGVLAMKRHRA